jgi:hypothetical protein
MMRHRALFARKPVIGRPFARSAGQSALRAQRDLLNRIKLMLPVQSPLAKIFPFPSDANHLHIPRHPGPHDRGVSRSSRTLGWDAMDASGAADESATLRTAKSCGPDAPTLASSW